MTEPTPSSGISKRDVAIAVFAFGLALGVQQIPGLTIQSEECTEAGADLRACQATRARDESSKTKAWCMYKACITGGDERACSLE